MRTLVYRYGLLPPETSSDEIERQLFASHRFYNELVALQEQYRLARESVYGSTYARAKEEYDLATAAVESELARVKAERGEKRSRKKVDTSVLTAYKAAQKVARTAWYEIRKAAEADPVIAQQVDTIRERRNLLRSVYVRETGVFWGTGNQVKRAVGQGSATSTGAKFHRWTGGGNLAVQVKPPMPAADICSGACSYLVLDLTPQPLQRRFKDAPRLVGRPLPRVRMRINSSEQRRGVWAQWPIIYGQGRRGRYGRPLPPDAIVTGAQVTRRMVAGRAVWSLQITASVPDAPPHPLQAQAIGVNLSWALKGPETTVATWAATDGRHGEVRCPERVTRGLARVAEIRSERDRLRDTLRTLWEGVPWPPEHQQRLRYLGLWCAQRHFVNFLKWWRANRWLGDDTFLEASEEWYRTDTRQWNEETHLRAKVYAHRLDVYRVVAKQLTSQYGTLVLETLNLSAFAKKKDPDEEGSSSEVLGQAASRAQRVATAPSEFRTALEHAAAARGVRVLYVPASPSADELLRAYTLGLGAEKEKQPARSKLFVAQQAAKAKKRQSQQSLHGGTYP